MKTNAGRRTLIEVERIHSFDDAPAEFVPRISLCEDAFRKALGAVATVSLLHDFEHQLVHTFHHSYLGSAHLPGLIRPYKLGCDQIPQGWRLYIARRAFEPLGPTRRYPGLLDADSRDLLPAVSPRVAASAVSSGRVLKAIVDERAYLLSEPNPASYSP